MASIKQSIKFKAKNKNAKYKMTYTYKQIVTSDKINYSYSKSIEPTTSTLKY